MQEYQKETIDTYNKNAEPYLSRRADELMHEHMAEFEKRLPGNKVLEIGSGPGRDARAFVDEGYHVTGIDLSQVFVHHAHEYVPEATFLVMDMLSLDFEDESFDGVWSVATFHHLQKRDVPKAYEEAYRVLKSGGVLFFTVKEGTGESNQEEKDFQGMHRFFSYFQEDEIKKYLKTVGFEILYIEHETNKRGKAFLSILAKKPL